jgi:biopolymer transport protein ExbD
MIRYRARKISAVIPTASMADIAFLMITFFMYTTTFSVDRTEVILPESFIRQLVEKDAAIIAITARGQINVSDGVRESEPAATPEALEQTVRDIIQKSPSRQFIVKCDKLAPYRAFNQVYEILLKTKARDISLLTERKAGAEGP